MPSSAIQPPLLQRPVDLVRLRERMNPGLQRAILQLTPLRGQACSPDPADTEQIGLAP